MTTRDTWHDRLHSAAEAQGIPLRTLDQVREALARAKKTKADAAMARLMLRHGRMTEDARQFVQSYGS